MLLEFARMEETIIPHFYGGEKETAARMFADERVRILYGRLAPGASIGIHTHIPKTRGAKQCTSCGGPAGLFMTAGRSFCTPAYATIAPRDIPTA